MEWKKAELQENGQIKIPDQWLHIHYYEALNILFRFENAIRVFVYIILKKHLGREWDTAALGDGITIRTEAKKRIHQAREHGYLGYESKSPMLYLNSGELIQILTSDTYWKHFAPYFKASKQIIQTKLQEIGTVRNSLAHFRPLKQDDIELIKQNSRHVLLEVENCLSQLLSTTDVVPTNTEDSWYKEIKSIGNEFITTALFSSPSKEWIRLVVRYKIPTLRKWTSTGYISATIGSIRVREVVRQLKNLRENCIYISEAQTWYGIKPEETIGAEKRISYVFALPTLTLHLEKIQEDLKSLATKIEDETTLISQDNLARGEFIESRSLHATKRDATNKNSYWNSNINTLSTPLTDIDDVEFWGEGFASPNEFITSTHLYPWMPSAVSKEDFPF